ncbi:hypothetical protein KKH39_01390 [Patescibacteria group bacterium]|nr:hypothetical protein [Patescibacteria group bacterium]
MNRVLKSPVAWSLLVIVLEISVLLLVPDHFLKRLISLLLAAPALLIWRLEKYQREIPFNRYSLLVSLLTVFMVLAIFLAYKNLCQWNPAHFQ